MSRIHKLSLFVHALKKVKMNKKLLPVRELFYAMTAKSVYYKLRMLEIRNSQITSGFTKTISTLELLGNQTR